MKRHHFLTIFLASFLFIFTLGGGDVFAQGSISGNDVCGKWDQTLNGGKGGVSDPCGADDLKDVFDGIFRLIISIGLPLLVVFIIYRFVMAWYALSQGNVNAYKEAGKKVTQAIIGFIIVVLISGGIMLALLKAIGVKSEDGDFNPLKLLQILKGTAFIGIEKAYAAGTCSPAPLGRACSFKDNSSNTIKNGIVDAMVTSGLHVCKETSTGTAKEADDSADTATNGYCDNKADGFICKRNDSGHTLGLCSGGTVPQTNLTIGSPCTANSQCASGSCAGGSPKVCAAAATAGGTTPPADEVDTELPNPLGVDSLYDFILAILNMVMKFFLYPALMGIWVYSGFLYVAAQGAPEKLKKAHNLLLWAVISTFIVFIAQGFLMAIKGTVNAILPGA